MNIGGDRKFQGGSDWECPNCKNVNFARRSKCNRCDAEGPGIIRTFDLSSSFLSTFGFDRNHWMTILLYKGHGFIDLISKHDLGCCLGETQLWSMD